jgi:hypothetical protein
MKCEVCQLMHIPCSWLDDFRKWRVCRSLKISAEAFDRLVAERSGERMRVKADKGKKEMKQAPVSPKKKKRKVVESESEMMDDTDNDNDNDNDGTSLGEPEVPLASRVVAKLPKCKPSEPAVMLTIPSRASLRKSPTSGSQSEADAHSLRRELAETRAALKATTTELGVKTAELVARTGDLEAKAAECSGWMRMVEEETASRRAMGVAERGYVEELRELKEDLRAVEEDWDNWKTRCLEAEEAAAPFRGVSLQEFCERCDRESFSSAWSQVLTKLSFSY